MLISATSDLDIFNGKTEEFWKYMKNAKKPDLLLLAGDITVYSRLEDYKTFLKLVERKKWKCPIIGIFGNREFQQDFNKFRKLKQIKFLNDEKIILKIKDKNIGIVGTRGSLDKPTWWQLKNVRGIRKIYLDRIKKIERLLRELKTDIRILLMHYAPTYKTLEGEDPKVYGSLGCEKFEQVVINTKPNFVIHGHAHYGIPKANLDSIPIHNVCVSVNKKIVEIKV
ncbi:MAG: metallophosphoesterase [Candidatus Aenigmatarchaeota archaeon]